MNVATILQCVASRSRGRVWLRVGWGGALLLAIVGGTAQGANKAAWGVDRSPLAAAGPIEVAVRVEGRGAPLYHLWNRPDRWYFQAAEGASYEVRVRNLTARRLGFVLAVDGLNAISGLQSRPSADEPMYVLGPYENATIKGWRRSLSHVNRFVFVDEERSYAERTDQGNGDLGWIRVLAFYERQPELHFRSGGPGGRPEGASPAAPQARRGEPLAPQEQDSHPGTGWGSREGDRARQVEFDPESYAAAHIILRYEYRAGLAALGILPWRDRDRDRLREREDGVYGFAQPPRR